MPHLLIEHSANIGINSIRSLEREIQNIMNGVEGDFEADQCKCRSIAFDAYLIGLPDQSTASFIHITLKALSGRSIEIRRNLSQRILEFTHKFFLNLKLPTRRCEITVDIVEMERETYTKILIKN
jgi:5-carboxymethyl-2-hydroxymuconate isomerase